VAKLARRVDEHRFRSGKQLHSVSGLLNNDRDKAKSHTARNLQVGRGEHGGADKMRPLPLLLSMPLLAACTTSQTDVLAPYTLANGQFMQDVVTVATDEKGAAPIVTVVNTYDVSRPRAELVSHDAASSPGLATVIAGGLAGSIPNAVATVAAAALREPDRININDCVTTQQGTSVGGEAGNGGDGGDGGTSVGVGASIAVADGGNGGAAAGGAANGGNGGNANNGGNGGAGGAAAGGAGGNTAGGAGAPGGTGGAASANGGAATAVAGLGLGIAGDALGGEGGEGGDAGAFTDLDNGDCAL
jgi:hypothetical protein